MTYDSKLSVEEQWQHTYENAATARRVTLTDASGGNISSGNPLPVDISTAGSKTPSIEFQTVATVPFNTLTTVLSFTNTGADLFLEAIGGTGTARSEWILYVDNVEKLRRRIGVANMNMDVRMFDYLIPTNSVVDIKVTHFESATQSFQSEVRYYR